MSHLKKNWFQIYTQGGLLTIIIRYWEIFPKVQALEQCETKFGLKWSIVYLKKNKTNCEEKRWGLGSMVDLILYRNRKNSEKKWVWSQRWFWLYTGKDRIDRGKL